MAWLNILSSSSFPEAGSREGGSMGDEGEARDSLPFSYYPHPKNTWKRKNIIDGKCTNIGKNIYLSLNFVLPPPVILFPLLFFELFSCMCVFVCFSKEAKNKPSLPPSPFLWRRIRHFRKRKERERERGCYLRGGI